MRRKRIILGSRARQKAPNGMGVRVEETKRGLKRVFRYIAAIRQSWGIGYGFLVFSYVENLEIRKNKNLPYDNHGALRQFSQSFMPARNYIV